MSFNVQPGHQMVSRVECTGLDFFYDYDFTKVPKPFKIPRSRIRELVNSPKDSGPNSSFKSEPQLTTAD